MENFSKKNPPKELEEIQKMRQTRKIDAEHEEALYDEEIRKTERGIEGIFEKDKEKK